MKCENPKIHIHNPSILDRGEDHFREIRVRKDECMKYLLFPTNEGVFERHIFVEEGGVFRGSAIALGSNTVLKLTVFIEGSHTEATLRLLGLVESGSTIETDGIGRVELGCQNVKLRVDQTNILLGTGARVKGRPVLEVATDSIEGGHSCRIHRISGEALFYLQSHGIDATTAEGMLLEAEITRHVEVMEERGEEMKEEIFQKFTKK